MMTAAALQTLVLASIAFGSAVFILVGILPSILPQVVRAMRDKGRKLADRARTRLEAQDEEILDRISEVTTDFENLSSSLRTMRGSIVTGSMSAVAFLFSGITGLYAFVFVPTYSVNGVEYVWTAPEVDQVIGATFAFGVFFMILFYLSLYNIMREYVAHSAGGGQPPAGVPQEARKS